MRERSARIGHVLSESLIGYARSAMESWAKRVRDFNFLRFARRGELNALSP